MNVRTLFSVTSVGIVMFLLFTSGIIRHDVKKKLYRKLANSEEFNSVGQVIISNDFTGSCVLIDQNYVLSAAHVFIESDTREDTMYIEGKRVIAYTPVNKRVASPNDIAIKINGHKYQVEKITLHPSYLDSTTEGTCDLAIIKLAEACTSSKILRCNDALDEMNSEIVGVGFGASGVASKPGRIKSVHEKIAGQNIVDSIGGYETDHKSSILFCDFDHPNNNSCNKIGSSEPRPLEYICSGGDSGGPLFRQKNGQWEIIGICSGSGINIPQFMKTGYYGQIMSWTRVSVFNDWIRNNTKAN